VVLGLSRLSHYCDREAGVAVFDEGQSGTGSVESTKVFGSMTFGNNTIRAQYEDTDAGSASNNSTEYVWLGYELKLGKGMLNVQYATVDPDGASNDHDMLTAAYIYKFNKQTRVWAGYQTLDYDAANSDTDRLGLGIRVDI